MDFQTIAAKPNCMTFGNMRTNGVRSLAITCGAMVPSLRRVGRERVFRRCARAGFRP
jgi:hypothetical protein